MVATTVLENVKMPKLIKTWLAITSMHAMNRGKQKLPRLGLTYLISGAADAGSRTSLGSKLSRFLATTAVAIVEKFSSGHHHHAKEELGDMVKREVNTLSQNITSAKQWKELLPTLINIEGKVQLIAPLIKFLVEKASGGMSGTQKAIFNTVSNIVLTSGGFVGFDQIIKKVAKVLGGENSSWAASLSSICGCCGSPVCSAAATDTALSNSM